jgi:arginyl-tRNA synthetase
MKPLLKGLIRDALNRAVRAGELPEGLSVDPPIEVPREAGHGDLSTSVAMLMARTVRKPPRQVAEILVKNLEDPEGLLQQVEIAGPGFVNLTLSPAAWRRRLGEILAAGDSYGSSRLGEGRRVQVEFVSANPTGPLHVGHGRGAATGDALARILEAAGFVVERE